jgi:hypothetical protein
MECVKVIKFRRYAVRRFVANLDVKNITSAWWYRWLKLRMKRGG